MKRLCLLFFALLALPPWSAEADDGAMPPQDLRSIRELQSRAFGTPTLDQNASRGEAVLALAGLDSAVSGASAQFQGSDYDALFSLLQRYRDELLKMGLDAAELDTQMKILQVRADELKDRLDHLHPKDGLKISGRLYSALDDLHLLGPAAIPGANGGQVPKPAGVGIRNQFGVVHAEVKLNATRGPLSGYIQFDMVTPWGLMFYSNNPGSIGLRRVYVELRMPITLQFGNFDTALTPLTLWRNEDQEPFEPEPFRSRRQRLVDDSQLQPHEWLIPGGGRLSTEMLLFGKQKLDFESTTALVAPPAASIYTMAGPAHVLNSKQERFNTYMEGWRAILPFGDDLVKVGYNGVLFWDDTSTGVTAFPVPYRSMNSLVQSFKAEVNKGIFWGDLEYALASYTPGALANTPIASPITGTAATYAVGLKTDKGHFRIFGRMVSSGFYSAGAQGRTEDAAYQYLSPFLTEDSQIGSNGQAGVDNTKIHPSFESQLNNILIPAGVINQSGPSTPWSNLLAYGFWENIDPYGDATPNRQGFGAEGDWKFFSGILTPKASYEMFSEIDPVTDVNSGLTVAPFTMTRLRAGAELDCKPMFGWPLRFSGGYTACDSEDGKMNLAGNAYDLSSALMEGGAEWDINQVMGINFGYRQIQVTGMNETFNFTKPGNQAWTIYGGGLWWKPVENLRFDAVYTQTTGGSPSLTSTALEVDQGLVRLTLGF